ncbi:uncharacterized protein LOC119391770 [Rhipicephalus sanguineus]|uniref:uncharacterized protein LOC119391770 n=1 Tax=Rhipicephalus sanguineus TaxID=34632 RepID=UPI0018949764|nr:uncharacterized protein LOC119391770 [Rhipicephalus sanguineus]
MDVTRQFIAFVLFATAAGGLSQVRALYQSVFNCRRIVPPVITTIYSPCTFPCVLPLGDGVGKVMLLLERDGTPCKGGFCKSGICKEIPSFPLQNHLKHEFISALKLPQPGFRYSNAKRNLQWLPPVNTSSNKAPKEADILTNTLQRISMTASSGASGNPASASRNTKHVAVMLTAGIVDEIFRSWCEISDK